MAISGEYWWLYLGEESVYWARRYGRESRPREEGEATTLRESPVPPGARVVACVPGRSVRLHWVAIPVRNRKRLLEALPYALEEELLRDPGDYHLVPLKPVTGMPERAIAVVEHERMAAWFQLLTEEGLRPRGLLPDYLGVAPPEPGTWVLDATRSPLLLRRPEGFGGASLPGDIGEQPPGALLLALEEARVPPEVLQIRAASGEDGRLLRNWEPWLEPFGVTLAVEEDARSREAWLARQPPPAGEGDLLTGPYTSREDPRVLGKRLAPAAGLALALLAVAGVQWVLEGQRLQTEHERLEAAIEKTYREAFPDARNIVDPRFQMANRLEKLRENGDGPSAKRDLLATLQQVAPALSEKGSERVKSLSFNGETLVMEVSVPDYGTLEELERGLARLGSVTVEKAELEGGRVASRIRFKGEA